MRAIVDTLLGVGKSLFGLRAELGKARQSDFIARSPPGANGEDPPTGARGHARGDPRRNRADGTPVGPQDPRKSRRTSSTARDRLRGRESARRTAYGTSGICDPRMVVNKARCSAPVPGSTSRFLSMSFSAGKAPSKIA